MIEKEINSVPCVFPGAITAYILLHMVRRIFPVTIRHDLLVATCHLCVMGWR